MRIALLCPLLLFAANAAEFYVATNGQDVNPGTKSKPFATIVRARNEVRKLVAKGLKSNVTVWIHGGTYTLTDTLVSDPRTPATDDFTITYAGGSRRGSPS